MTKDPPSRRGRIWRILGLAAALIVAGLAVTHVLTSHTGSPFETDGESAGALFVLAALAACITEDLTCIGAGIAAGAGRMTFVLAAAACFTGIVVSDVALYLLGRFVGPAALRARPMRWVVKETDVQRCETWMRKRAVLVLTLVRLLPAVRVPAYFAAGMLGVRPVTFLVTLFVTVAVYVVALVGVSTWAGEALEDHFHSYDVIAAVAIGIIALVLLIRFALWRIGPPETKS